MVGARNPEELAWNLPSLDLQLDSATVAELEQLTQPVKQSLGQNVDMWFADSRMR